MIKPDHVNMAEEILKELDNHAERVDYNIVNSVPSEIIEKHYEEHKGKYFYDRMIKYYVGKSVVIALYKGENIREVFDKLIGATDPSKADLNSIRARYSDDSFKKCDSEGRPLKNVIHRSDSEESAERELKIWGDYFQNI